MPPNTPILSASIVKGVPVIVISSTIGSIVPVISLIVVVSVIVILSTIGSIVPVISLIVVVSVVDSMVVPVAISNSSAFVLPMNKYADIITLTNSKLFKR